MNVKDRLLNLRDDSPLESGTYRAYDHALSLIETIENLNVLNWKLMQAQDDAESAGYSPDFRIEYLAALENAHRIVLELRDNGNNE
jgi:hypothetical protein